MTFQNLNNYMNLFRSKKKNFKYKILLSIIDFFESKLFVMHAYINKKINKNCKMNDQ